MTGYLWPDETSGESPDVAIDAMTPFPTTDATVALLVVEPDPAVRSRLVMQLGEHAVALDSVDGIEERYAGSPVLMVLGPTCARTPGLHGAEDLLARRPELGAILVAEDLSTDLFQRAIRSGVRDVLGAPVDTGQLNEAVNRVAQTLVVGRPPAAAGVLDEEAAPSGKVITVFSTKGGAGKSVVASNLGVLLAQRAQGTVALVDADLQFGDIAVMLKLAPQHTIVDAVGQQDRLDPAFLESLLVTHPPSGLKVLPAPLEPAFADQITADQVRNIVAMLRSFCDYVVIDTPAYFNEVVLSLIEDSDDVLLVAGMDIPNIKNVKIGLQTLRLLHTPMSKVHLVLNRANSKVKLEVSEVERTLQVRAESQLPSDVVVPQSVNKGAPVVLDAPRSGIAKSLEQLAARFLPAGAEPAKKRGWR